MNDILKQLEDIVVNKRNIGISVSGGLDSTLLAYLLHDIKHKTNSPAKLQYFCVPRPDDSIVHVERVVAYIDSYFKQPPSKIHIVGDGTLHHREQVKSGMREAVQKYDIDVLVTGVTKTPESCEPPEYLPNYEYGKFIDPDGTPYNGPVRVKTQNPKFINPFWGITKVETVGLIKELGLAVIPEITHSCTGSKSIRCGRCWQCCERAWAFSKNDFIDKGTM